MHQPAYTEESGRQELEKKQAILAAIIDSSEDAIISKTLEGMITSWNRSAERMFGYTEAEVAGRHISILIPEDHLQEEDMIIDRIRHGQRVPPFQTVRRAKDGHLIPVSITVSPIRSKEGTVIGASKIARDISEQLRAMRELEEHAKTQELLLSASKAISAQLDLQTILQKVTDIVIQLTGAEFGAFYYDRQEESMPTASHLEVPVTSHTGNTIGGLHLGHSKPGMFREEHRRLVGAIAAQAGVAIENAKLYEEIKQLNMRKDEFIGVAGHELRTPTTTIKGYLQLLEDHASEAEGREFIGKALRQVNKLNRLVGDLLDVTKIQSGRLEYNQVTCLLLPLVRESVDMARQIYTSHRIEVELPVEDIVITADGAKIEQVVVNLLTNAIKYSPGGERVALCVKRETGRVVVAVRDWGIGIAPEHFDNIFDRYYRVASSEHVVGGLGIGLYISREIVQRHGGEIWVESDSATGSVFYFSLPLPE